MKSVWKSNQDGLHRLYFTINYSNCGALQLDFLLLGPIFLRLRVSRLAKISNNCLPQSPYSLHLARNCVHFAVPLQHWHGKFWADHNSDYMY